jgi:hypothetical protein
VTSIFPCQIVDFPIKFLGIPLGVFKLPKIAWQPLLDRVGDRLATWRGRLLRCSGRLTLIKTTMAAIPIYTCIAVGIPPWLLGTIRKLMTTFLWTGTDMVQAGKCLVAWKQVQRPLQLGGLGVMDLDLLGIALRTHWLWLRYMDCSRPWASIKANEDKRTSAFFFASVRFVLGDGATFLFWVDPWLDGKCIADLMPDLAGTIPARRRRNCTVAYTMQGLAWIRDIKGALTVQVIMQYLQLFQMLQSVQLRPGAHDQLVWRCNPNGCYSSRSAYAALMLGQSSVLGCKELWKTKAPNNCRFFVWLVLLGRCWTTDRLHRRGLRSNSTCILCCQGIETIDHILVQCVFTCEVWFKGLRRFGWQTLAPMQGVSYAAWWMASRKRVLKGRRRAFDSLCVLIAWVIWLHRNDRTFNRSALHHSLAASSVINQIFDMVQSWMASGIVDRSQIFGV